MRRNAIFRFLLLLLLLTVPRVAAAAAEEKVACSATLPDKRGHDEEDPILDS